MIHAFHIALLSLVVMWAVPGSVAANSPAAFFDYLTVRAHEGDASGGHAAIRFGAETFDFQRDGGLLRPRREDSRRFQHSYRTLQNRGIELTRVAAAPETVAQLREAFERRLLAQERQLALQDDLRRDVGLLEALRAGPQGEVRVAVRGAGFFADSTDSSAPPPAALVELRVRISARHGAAWLPARRAQAERALHDLSLAPVDVDAVVLDPLRYPVVPDSTSRRAQHALAVLTAIDALERPRPLRAEACLPSTGDAALGLDADGVGRVREARAVQLEAAAALAASRRPDWGEALLLAMARLVAFDASIAARELIVLDALPPDARALHMTERRRELLPVLLGEARVDLAGARARFFAGAGLREADWAAVEEAASRVAALRAAWAGSPSLRVASGALVPEGRANVPLTLRPAATPEAIERALAAASEAERRYRRALEAHFKYELITRNCVSELFRTVEAALGGTAGALRAESSPELAAWLRTESERRLGGYIEPVARGNFIPFVSSRNVRARWAVVDRVHLPSYREHQVAALRAREGAWRVALRESSVFTSTLSAPADDSGFFVFFTDGRWPLRPLLGAANLGAALARSGVGLLQLPFDGGRGLRSGLEGAVWSVPELFFANVRKGGNEYVPPALRPPPG